jgi:hypothetical protein
MKIVGSLDHKPKVGGQESDGPQAEKPKERQADHAFKDKNIDGHVRDHGRPLAGANDRAPFERIHRHTPEMPVDVDTDALMKDTMDTTANANAVPIIEVINVFFGSWAPRKLPVFQFIAQTRMDIAPSTPTNPYMVVKIDSAVLRSD